jgi:hypothetical protein
MIEIKRSQVPLDKQVIKSTWVFCRKRRPSGEIYKLKARFVIRGDLQILDDALNGDVRVAKLWYKHLQEILIHQLKFTISTIDSCLFLCKDIIFIFYVDDGIIISKETKEIDHFIAELRLAGLDLGVEEDYAGYLGVEVKPNEDGSLLLCQIGLIERILSDIGLTNSPSHK